MKLTLKIWRQENPKAPGAFKTYELNDVSEHSSFLEMLDILNEDLCKKGETPVEFDSDCREGICGACGFVINGHAHGKEPGTTVCQLHMRKFTDGETLTIEPFRARAFPVIKDLVVDRTSFERIQHAGGFVSTRAGPHADANAILISKDIADQAMDVASCIGCGACVAACPNASASLFTGAKITQYALLPQGHPEREVRVQAMVNQMDKEGFGNCTNIGECHAACPKEVPLDAIATMKREFMRAMLKPTVQSAKAGDEGA